jgi:hypothetical protein
LPRVESADIAARICALQAVAGLGPRRPSARLWIEESDDQALMRITGSASTEPISSTPRRAV